MWSPCGSGRAREEAGTGNEFLQALRGLSISKVNTPATIPQNAEPIENRVNPEAVTMKVISAASRSLASLMATVSPFTIEIANYAIKSNIRHRLCLPWGGKGVIYARRQLRPKAGRRRKDDQSRSILLLRIQRFHDSGGELQCLWMS